MRAASLFNELELLGGGSKSGEEVQSSKRNHMSIKHNSVDVIKISQIIDLSDHGASIRSDEKNIPSTWFLY